MCLQAYLFRTREDLADVMARGIGVRLVKGAYNEPATVAFPKKSDVDANYLALAQAMLEPGSRASGARPVFGTHDLALIDTIRRHAAVDATWRRPTTSSTCCTAFSAPASCGWPTTAPRCGC